MSQIARIKDSLKQDIITAQDINTVLNKTDNSRYGLVKRAIHQKMLIPLRRGLYHLGKSHQRHPINLFVIAQYLYGPSYISCESALEFYGWIPESVPSITSACTLRNKKFSNDFGDFVYYKLPLKNFFCETEHHSTQNGPMITAKPWKAILDYVYIFKKNWKSLAPLIKSLRIEEENLYSLKDYNIERLEDFYHQKRISIFLDSVIKELTL